MRDFLEYVPVWLLIKLLGIMPRRWARAVGIGLGRVVFRFHRRLQSVGLRNLEIAFPEMSLAERSRLVRQEFDNLGRLLAESARLPRYRRNNVAELAVYEGLEHFQAAQARGRGVLLLTAHLGGWEVGSFVHSLCGYPMRVVIRELDNPHVNRLAQRYRTLHGNTTFGKQEFARGLLSAMRAGETVGLLMDTNMTPPQGVFVPFFGVPACTASGLARVALRTRAAVVPAFTIWDRSLGKYRIHFDPPLELLCTGDEESDAVANTALFTRIIEDYVRRYPEQWLWVHRRWKTRPPGQPSLY
jgi:KDO2-lipid IV(A) lauroyltransferase